MSGSSPQISSPSLPLYVKHMLSRLIIIIPIPRLLARYSVSLTFAVDLEVNNDWLHSSLTVPP